MPPDQAGHRPVAADEAAGIHATDTVRRLRPDEPRPAPESFETGGSGTSGPVPIACGPLAARDRPRPPAPAATSGPDAVAGAVLALVAEVLGGDRPVRAG